MKRLFDLPHTAAGPPCGAASVDVPVGGAPTYDDSAYGLPAYGLPVYGLPVYGSPVCGLPVCGEPAGDATADGAPVDGAPAGAALGDGVPGSGARFDGGANGFAGWSGVVTAARASASWCPILA